MDQRQLGRNGPWVSVLGFGAFKIGRNENTKYGASYPLPDLEDVAKLLNSVLDLGVNYIDTAPAYGVSEERIGKTISHRRSEFVLSTKIGEVFQNGISTYDFTRGGIEKSVKQSLTNLRTDLLDIVFIHANASDLQILNETDAVETLLQLQESGLIRCVGLSAKTPEAARQSMSWADVLMLEYHLSDTSQTSVIEEAAKAGIGVVVKKALSSGHLPAADALRFVLSNPKVSSAVVGSINLEHLRCNIATLNSMHTVNKD